jgi:hypothetical protein
MLSLRVLALVVAAALPLAALGGEKSEQRAPKDFTEYDHSDLVVGGRVVSVEYLDGDGTDAKKAISGPFYRVVLKVSVIHKMKNASAKVNDDVTVVGQARDKKEKPVSLPKEKAVVLAFLKKKDARVYEPTAPTMPFWCEKAVKKDK